MDKRSSYLTISERLCAVCIPVIGIIEAAVLSFVGCCNRQTPPHRLSYTYSELSRISSATLFSVNEVEALLDLFKKLSCSIIDDGLIHKTVSMLIFLLPRLIEELALRCKQDTPFCLHLLKCILITFTGRAPVGTIEDSSREKSFPGQVAFRLYDLRHTGYIEQEEVMQMLDAIFQESGVQLSEDHLQAIIDETFEDADADKDGKINKEEWKAFVIRHPTLLKNMTLPYLKDITTLFTSFIFNTEVVD